MNECLRNVMKRRTADAAQVVGEHPGQLLSIQGADGVQHLWRHLASPLIQHPPHLERRRHLLLLLCRRERRGARLRLQPCHCLTGGERTWRRRAGAGSPLSLQPAIVVEPGAKGKISTSQQHWPKGHPRWQCSSGCQNGASQPKQCHATTTV